MVDFHQFLMIIFMESIKIWPAYIRGGQEGHRGGVGGDKG